MYFLTNHHSSFMIHEKLKFVTAEMRNSERKLRWNPVSYFFFSVIYENMCSEKRSHECHLMKSRLHCGGGDCRGKLVTVSQESRFINPRISSQVMKVKPAVHPSEFVTHWYLLKVPLELRLPKHTHFIHHTALSTPATTCGRSKNLSKCAKVTVLCHSGSCFGLNKRNTGCRCRSQDCYRFTDSNPRGGKFEVFLSQNIRNTKSFKKDYLITDLT